ncbi:junctional adhesion molecule 2A-like [Euwallacea similis]|uniref:junctional adhesion molecule 2A-like n=1 Tax=Euwallacea similis TaxID=1736056 RepID=UPI00344ED0C1
MESFLIKLPWWLVLAAALLRVAHSGSSGLKWVRVNVPQFKVPGENAQLHCDYDLGNDSLYSVKWYKEHEEFYRYVPKSRPPDNSYKVEGVLVDRTKSDSRKVVLLHVDWKTSGLYRCEVSAEAPSFASAQSEARMEVVSLPNEDPIITGMDAQYNIGDEINLNCTSGRSRPASVLHWYINEQQIQKPEALINYPEEHHAKGLVTATLGLRFNLSNRHFLGGSMKIKCVASILPVFSDDSETVVHSLPVRDMRHALLLVKSSSSSSVEATTLLTLLTLSIVIFPSL